MTKGDKPSSPKSVPLSADIADKLLGLLEDNDEFRDQFSADPLSALASIGYSFDSSAQSGNLLAPFAGCRVSQLASKQDLSSARSELKSIISKGLAYTTPQLEASNFDRLFRK